MNSNHQKYSQFNVFGSAITVSLLARPGLHKRGANTRLDRKKLSSIFFSIHDDGRTIRTRTTNQPAELHKREPEMKTNLFNGSVAKSHNSCAAQTSPINEPVPERFLNFDEDFDTGHCPLVSGY
ncbi:hypothetical protein ACFE04_019557 [Oxalis oulophora]